MTETDAKPAPTGTDHQRGRVAVIADAAGKVAVFWLWPLHIFPPLGPTGALVWVTLSVLVLLLWERRLAVRWRLETRDSWARVAGTATWNGAVVAAAIFLFVR